MLPVVAIVGRPNVGKSTLFNRLVGSRQALVHDRPGVTRDRNYGTAMIGEREIVLIDTGGLEMEPDDDLFDAIRVQATAAIEEADVILLVVDRTVGLVPADQLTAQLLRRKLGSSLTKRVILVVNKCDAYKHEDESAEFYALGIDSLHCVSAAHGRGVDDLYDLIEERLPDVSARAEGGRMDPGEVDGEIRVAIIGRPNIGKSTLVNRLIGEERHVVHDAPGTTMDSIDSVVEIDGQVWRFVDTAGVRRKARIHDPLETFATSRAIRTIERCHVTLLMIDGTEGPSHQDARLAALVAERGRAVVVLLNRWDLVKDDPERNSGVLEDELEQTLPHLSWARALYISALTGKGCHKILPTVLEAYAEFDRRIGTSELNRWLEATVEANPPPQRYNNPVRLNYATQTRVRPPSFVVFCNSPDGIDVAYQRFLEKRLRDAFGFQGTPIRMQFNQKRKPGEPVDE
jgi:GTPase